MIPLKTSSAFKWPLGRFKLKAEGAVCGLAELMIKGLQVDAHSPIKLAFLTLLLQLSASSQLPTAKTQTDDAKQESARDGSNSNTINGLDSSNVVRC